MLAIMGTSTCHVMNGAVLADVPGICGVVDGGIIAGSYGYEAGQSAVGDIFAWWIDQVYRSVPRAADERGENLHEYLSPDCATSRSAATAWSRWTGWAATGRCSSTTTCPA